MSATNCRIWWPMPLSAGIPQSDLLLFGWCFASGPSGVDVVVSSGIPAEGVNVMVLKEALQHANHKVSRSLQEFSTLSLLGYYAGNLTMNNFDCKDTSDKTHGCTESSNRDPHDHKNREKGMRVTSNGEAPKEHDQLLCKEAYKGPCNCEDYELTTSLELERQAMIQNGIWIQPHFVCSEFFQKSLKWFPNINHLHWHGQLFCISHLHVIMYEPPVFSGHHFSLNAWGSSAKAEITSRKPYWFSNIDKKHPTQNLDAVILSLNCSYTTKETVEMYLKSKCSLKQRQNRSTTQTRSRALLTSIFWNILSIALASISTAMYITLHICHKYHSFLKPYVNSVFEKIFCHASVVVRIRAGQLFYWAVFLQDYHSSSIINVEYLHKAALRRHSVWSSIVVDILLGNLVGLLLLAHSKDLHLWVTDVCGDFTNSLLRSGCVWLMGVPAGFKLNTELAELFGAISLNATQIWSTLWFFTGFAFQYIVFCLSLSGILLGITVPAALFIDILKLATLHISILHWLISCIYSQQIQALASLWRLFRGRKWNPLRNRLDSYDFTVEEHVVGSLLFTPILLLLPTTSVFYIFFTSINSILSIISVMVEVMILALLCTPFAEILLWILKKGRFPSGLWFDTNLSHKLKNDARSSACNDHEPTKSCSLDARPSVIMGSTTVISVVHSNFANIGQILMPRLAYVFRRFSVSSGMSSIQGILSGQSISITPHTSMPPSMPWINIQCAEYWLICRDAVLSSIS